MLRVPVAARHEVGIVTYQEALKTLEQAAVDAADDLRFLSQLELVLQPLCHGTAAAAADGMPPLLDALKMVDHDVFNDVFKRRLVSAAPVAHPSPIPPHRCGWCHVATARTQP